MIGRFSMKPPKLSLTLLTLLGAVSVSSAASIVWVSDQFVGAAGSDNVTSPNGTFTGGVGPYADQGFINMLTAAGHTVTRFNPADTPNVLSAGDVATMNTYDLVILGRSGNSSLFDTAVETLPWNTGITKPLLSTNTYFSRSSRLGWFSTAAAPIQPDQVLNSLTFTNPVDPVQAYIIGTTAMTGNTTMSSITQAINFPADNAVDTRGISNITQVTITPGASILATSTVGADQGVFLASWPAGLTLTASGTGAVSSGQILGGYRMMFLAGNRESGTAPNTGVGNAGYENLTAEGEAMFLRAIKVAVNNGVVPIVPEPTAALSALAGLGLILRRRSVR
jgi:hypothetical protein